MFESNRDILGLCYDSIEEIRDGFYIVKDDKGYKIIDAGNNKILGPYINKIIHIGNKVFINKDGMYQPYDIFNFNQEVGQYYSTIEPFAENAYVVSTDYMGLKGIINANAQLVLPVAYKNIWISRQDSTHDFIKARLSYKDFEYANAADISYIIMDKNYTNPDCYFALETDIEGTQIVVSSLKKTHYKYGGVSLDVKYKLRYNGKIVGDELSSIMVRDSLKSFGLVQTYQFSKNKTTTGLSKVTGEIIVPFDKYLDVQYIGNGITIVKGENGYGTYSDGKEIVEVGKMPNTFILGNIPITATIIDDKQYYVGNDGNIYDKLEMAFPIYKSKIDNNVNLICLYGNWIYVTNNLSRIINIDSKLKDNSLWVKI